MNCKTESNFLIMFSMLGHIWIWTHMCGLRTTGLDDM